jgi:hypothetical protein
MIRPTACLNELNSFQRADPSFVRGAVVALLEPYTDICDPGNNLRGTSVLGIAERCLKNAGVDIGGMPRHATLRVNALYTTSDFPSVLNGVSQAAFQAGWDAGPQYWQQICAPMSVRSLRAEQRVYVGGFGLFAKIPEGTAVKAITIPGYSTMTKADRYGVCFGITEEAIVNNDLGEFIAKAKSIGNAAAITVSKLVMKCLEDNAALLDGGALFNSTAVTTAGGHANLAASGSGITKTAIGVGKASMRSQPAPGGQTKLGIRARSLIVPAELEDPAWDAAGLPNGMGEPGTNLERYMLDAGRVGIVSTPYLSGNAWYLAADPDVAPLLHIAFLNGVSQPRLTAKENFNSGGMDYVAELDFGVTPADFRGGYKDPGSA